MKVILNETIHKLGAAGDVVVVADGFARNYLLPKKMVTIATVNTMKKVDTIKVAAQEKAERKLSELRELAGKLNGLTLSFARRADDDNRLYGSVSDIDIVAEILKTAGTEVSRDAVVLDKHIKELGQFETTLQFGNNISSVLKIEVVKEEQ